MESPAKKKVMIAGDGDEDRISSLPDELIHKILSFLDAEAAVQSSVLSKRWKLIWTTLPFLNFGWYCRSHTHNKLKFVRDFCTKRNNKCHVFEFKLCVFNSNFRVRFLEREFVYAIRHNVQSLNLKVEYIKTPLKLSTFSSKSLKELTLEMKLDECESTESNCWNLPALTTLHLKRRGCHQDSKLSDFWITCLPALRTLCLDDWDLAKSSFSFSLPALVTLRLKRCELPDIDWNFPALITLELYDVSPPKYISGIVSALVNLQNLTIHLTVSGHHFISCPQLINLNISTSLKFHGNIAVVAPKLCNFSSVGIFTIMFGIPALKNVSIKLRGWLEHQWSVDNKKYYQQFLTMFPGLSHAENLSFDSKSIEALSAISDLLSRCPSPFNNLNSVKLPQGYTEASISSALRNYLLGRSQRGTIVTTSPWNDRSPRAAVVSVKAQNEVRQLPLEATTKELVDFQHIYQTVDMQVREEVGVEHSVVNADRVGPTDAQGTKKDQANSSRDNKNFGIWRGHEVNSEFVCLLDRIQQKYPETFEHFTSKNKKLCTMRLNMLCTSVNDFTKLSLTGVDFDVIAEYRDVFAYLQNQGLNVSWLINRLNYIEQLQFSKPMIHELHAIDCRIADAESKRQDLQTRIDDTKTKLPDLQARVDDANDKLQNLQTLRVEKMTEIQKGIGTMGTNLVVGFIGDDLLSGP